MAKINGKPLTREELLDWGKHDYKGKELETRKLRRRGLLVYFVEEASILLEDLSLYLGRRYRNAHKR